MRDRALADDPLQLMQMRPATIVLGAAGVAIVVLGVGLAVSRTKLAKDADRAIAEYRTDPRPEPPLGDLPRELSTMSDVEASALLFIDDHLFTRFDSARAVKELPCDEGMPDRLLFAADGKVLDAKPAQSSYDVRVELVTVGSAIVAWDGCTMQAAQVDDSVRTDTVHVHLDRSDGRWQPYYAEVVRDGDHLPLVGPLHGFSGANWSVLGLRADSIRQARGKPVARVRKPTAQTHLLQDAGWSRYPQHVERSCAAGAPAPVSSSFARMTFVDPEYSPNLFDISGTWWAIYEPNDSGGRACVTPVTLKLVQRLSHYCNQQAPRDAGIWAADEYTSRPMLLVRDVEGLRTGAQRERFSILTVPGWDRGLLVHSDSGEVLRVIEMPEGAGGYRLTAQYRRHDSGIGRGSPGETWGIYWVGLLNADSIPDFVLRTTTSGEHETQHLLTLFISHPERRDGLWIPESSNTVVRTCS